MTTATVNNGRGTNLEELVGRLMDALWWGKPQAQKPALTHTISGAWCQASPPDGKRAEV